MSVLLFRSQCIVYIRNQYAHLLCRCKLGSKESLLFLCRLDLMCAGKMRILVFGSNRAQYYVKSHHERRKGGERERDRNTSQELFIHIEERRSLCDIGSLKAGPAPLLYPPLTSSSRMRASRASEFGRVPSPTSCSRRRRCFPPSNTHSLKISDRQES